MSIRAYKIKRIEIEENPTFNVWHDEELCHYLSLYEQLNIDNCGIVEISVGLLKEAIEECTLSKKLENNIKKDIKDLSDDDYIQYYCF